MSVLLKFVYKFNIIPRKKIPTVFFSMLGNQSKLHLEEWRCERLPTFLKKNEKECAVSDTELHYKALIIKTASTDKGTDK